MTEGYHSDEVEESSAEGGSRRSVPLSQPKAMCAMMICTLRSYQASRLQSSSTSTPPPTYIAPIPTPARHNNHVPVVPSYCMLSFTPPPPTLRPRIAQKLISCALSYKTLSFESTASNRSPHPSQVLAPCSLLPAHYVHTSPSSILYCALDRSSLQASEHHRS
jgi:hypothetical protein